jgi:predicted metallo-beta-lactamase superfamily hydrolase
LAGFKVREEQIQAGLMGLEQVVEVSQMVILEHHILRSEDWREKTKNIFKKASKTQCKVFTAAEFLGKENVFLEAARKRLYVENPPSNEFERWMRGSATNKKHVKPPI